MALSPGSRLGPYEIAAQIGVGGMGEVYQATDTNLKRLVAIKVLPATLAGDHDRLVRFQREAEVLAALNHPNIAHIFGLEKADGTLALVMELVEGPTLADRIAQGPIARDEALPIAKQIAEALEAAHEQGVVHRDLKPANIKVKADGTVKVLDFGLAKAMDPAGPLNTGATMSPTISMRATQAGIILGTAAYMSPEQAAGKPVDKRSDVWAFGVVLLEMLTGRQVFDGETVSHVLAAVLTKEPDWTTIPRGTPAPIQRLLRRCLEKDRKKRLADASDARLEIEDAMAPPTADAEARLPQRRAGIPVWVAVPLGIAVVVVAAAAGARVRPSTMPTRGPGVVRLALPVSSGTELADGPSVAISPDGAQVAYVASRNGIAQLYIRAMDGLEARAIADTRGAIAPFFSPDGKWLAFVADGKLKKVSTTGGVVVTLTDANAGGGDWGPKDTIVFRSAQHGLAEIPAAGGEPRGLLTPEQAAASIIRLPEFLPGGDTLLVVTAARGARSADEASIEVLTLRTGQLKTLLHGSSQAHYLPTGHLVFLQGGTLMAVPLDLARLELTGSPVQVMSGVRQQLYTGVGAFTCSRSGTCAYVAGGAAAARTVAMVDRTGEARALPLPRKSYAHPRFSSTGDKISWWIEQLRCYIEIYDVARGTVTRLASDRDDHFPIWAPGGQRITYLSGGPGGYEIVSQPVNGSGSEEPLTRTPRHMSAITPLSWSPAGVLAFADRGDIWLLPGDGDARPFEASPFNETAPAFSPDGHWLAYVSDQSGRFEVYVRPFPGPGEKFPISTAGGLEPAWAHNGRELFFRSGDQMMVVDVETKRTFSASRPRLLFTGAFTRTTDRVNYDVSPDDKSFVMVNSGEEDRGATQITVVLNWFEELQSRMPTK